MPPSFKNLCSLFIAILAMSSGCRNSCQQLCIDIEELAKECGYQFTDEMKRECMENQGKKNAEERSSCNQAKPLLDSEWTCDDLVVYFDQSTISGEEE